MKKRIVKKSLILILLGQKEFKDFYIKYGSINKQTR